MDMFDECEKAIDEIPPGLTEESYLTFVADIERRLILETRLAVQAIREFPRDLADKAEGIIGEFSLIPDARLKRRSGAGFERGDRAYNTARLHEDAKLAREYAVRERKSIVVSLLREVFRELVGLRIETKFGKLDGDPRAIRLKKARFYQGKKGRR